MEVGERMEHVESMEVHNTGSTHIIPADTMSRNKTALINRVPT